MKNIIFNADKDVRLVPYSPVSQYEKIDIRLQFFNAGDKKETVKASVYLDEKTKENELYSAEISAEPKSFGFVKIPASFLGKVGSHSLLFCIDDRDSQTVPLVVLKNYPNIVDGGFVVVNGTVDERRAGKKLRDEDWVTLTNDYDNLGFKTIIVQYCAGIVNAERKEYAAYYDNSSVFGTADGFENVHAIDKILETAEKNGQHVFLGLLFGKIDLDIHFAFIKDLYDRFSKYKSLYGWYSTWEYSMCREVNEYDYGTSVIESDISNLRAIADKVSPCMPILYSPYLTSDMNCGHRCGTSASLLEAIADGRIKIDILAPHDHCGQIHKLSNQRMITIEDAVRMYATLKQACDKGGVHLWANCECFNLSFTESENGTGGYYKFAHSLINKHIGGTVDGEGNLISHAAALRNYSERIITFMLYRMFKNPDSSVPLGDENSEDFYRRYAEYIRFPYPRYRNVARGKTYSLVSSKPLCEPDRAYTFYDQFKYGGRDIFHKNHEKGGLLTDGLMFGATPDDSDVYLTLGSPLEEYGEQCRIEVVIDLSRETPFEKVRWFAPKNEKFYPDRVLIEYSHDGKNFFYFGEDYGKFVNGWGSVSTDREIVGRYVRLVFEKTNRENWKNWLILDEIEVLSKE